MIKLKYKKLYPYKYQLLEDYTIFISIIPDKAYIGDFLMLNTTGCLLISRGYAWDGASGPTIDTQSTMRASLVHDALYQLMRLGHLPQSQRLRADQIFHKILLEDGMNKIRAWYYYRAVRIFGGGAAKLREDANES